MAERTGMEKKEVDGLALWNFAHFPSGQAHFVTGRQGGVSNVPFDSLNLSFSAGDTPENVKENRARLAAAMGLPSSDLIFVSQCHSSDIIVIAEESQCKEIYQADALVTTLRKKCICVMGADCVPILVYDPVKEVVGAIHAGWRGTAAKICAKTISLMEKEFGCLAKNLLVGIGPSISQENYEVGEDVFGQFKEEQPDLVNKIFKESDRLGKYQLDLWAANKIQALEAGVAESHIEISGICTYSSHNKFFSARYFKNSTGRLAAGIMLV